MANQWFRLYHEFATDPKIQMMSEVYQRRYIMVLCLRCCNDDVTLHDEEVAFQLRISNEEWAETKAVFVAKNLVKKDNTPTAWDKRQYVSDSSAERVARHRAKKKAASKQVCNVTVTPPDTDTDTDNINTPNGVLVENKVSDTAPNGNQKLINSEKPKRRTRIPSDFSLSPDQRQKTIEYWASKNRSDICLDDEIEKFTNYHAGQGTTMLDWQAAWRTWRSNALNFTRPQNENRKRIDHRLEVSAATYDYERATNF